MIDIFPFNSKKLECAGRMEPLKKGFMIDCRKCRGMKEASQRDCFRGVASRLHPGFNGSIILRSNRDVMYEGAIVEAMTSFNDIEHLFGSLIAAAKNEKVSRSLMSDILCAREDFITDPALFLERKRKYCSKIDDDGLLDLFNEIIEKTSLMMRRLKRS